MLTTDRPPCGEIFTNISRTVTIEEIQSVHGVRTPTPVNSQKAFSIGFIANSYQRPLNSNEMTFYEILADRFTKPPPADRPDPIIRFGWVSIANYFGEGTAWKSEVLTLIRPKITKAERLTDNSFRVTGEGYPSRNYNLLGSTNLTNWTVLNNQAAATNGILTLTDNATTTAYRFYRITTP